VPPREARPKKPGAPDAAEKKERSKFRLYAAGAGLLAIVIVVVWLLSWRNSRYLYLECREDKVIAARGSSWPWGRQQLGGAAYRPIKLPPEADCRSREFTETLELERSMVELLIARAEAGLRSKKVEEVAEAKAQLTQALLLSRSYTEQKPRIQHLQGDLSYREGGQSVAEAQKKIEEAIARFKDAKERQPVLFKDYDAWIEHLEAANQALRDGPRPIEKITEAADQPAPPPGARPRVDRGVLPQPSASPDAALPAAPKPDGGLPSGGVLM